MSQEPADGLFDLQGRTDMTDTAASRASKLWTMIKDIRFAMFTARHCSTAICTRGR